MVLSRPSLANCIAFSCMLACGCQNLQPVSTPMTMDMGAQQQVIPASATESSIAQVAHYEALSDQTNGQPLASEQEVTVALPPTANEGFKVSLPVYRIEPPDILLIDSPNMIPKEPYYIQPIDLLQIFVGGARQDAPIAGTYQVEPSGVVNLGPGYGTVEIAGLTPADAIEKITQHLQQSLAFPEVSLSVAQIAGQQLIAGEHLVGPDGTVNLGIYGSVYVAGMTLEEAKAAIEYHLSSVLESPRISLDVFAYNSKVYYIITEGAGLGENVFRVPVTGNETVLDSIAQIGGLSQLSSTDIWIARPGPPGSACNQILPIDWESITRGGSTTTNYQIFPGDRVFIAEDRMRAFDGMVAKFTAPFERIAGTTLLWSQTIQTLQRFPEGVNRF